MDKLRINLIPPEIKERAKRDLRRSTISRISVGLLGILILLTSIILAIVIFQGARLGALSSEIEQEKSKIGSLKDKEAVMHLLKNRIDTINQFTQNKYKQGEVYDLMTSLFSPGITLSSMRIDKGSKVTVTGDTGSTASLQNFFDNLTDPKINEGKVSGVNVESLSKNPKGSIRFDLGVTLREGVY